MVAMPRTDRLRGQASDIPHLVDALAHHYATQGWQLDAPPAGGALEFSMHRGREAWLVDCAYMDEEAVSRIPVEELLDEIVLRGATGGVLVTRGVFTDAALDAAAQRPHLRLVDGAALAVMVGARNRAPSRRAGVFLLSLSLGLMVLVAYLLMNGRESRAPTPTVAPARVAPLPASALPTRGDGAQTARRAVLPTGASGAAHVTATTPAASRGQASRVTRP